ncbi:MAG: nucleoside deaminase [Planctomycetota bacterium]
MASPAEQHMRLAIRLAEESVARGGGPFGAVVVRSGTVVATGANRVVVDRDPTAHAEVVALRAAAQAVGSHVLTGTEVYASCEPCPMCLGALLWARVDRVWFGASRHDAAAAGFDDARLYDELALPLAARRLPSAALLAGEAQRPFAAWRAFGPRVPY